MNTIYLTAYFSIPLGLLILGLGLNVSRLRIKNAIILGDGGNTKAKSAIRAHGNATEFIPIFLFLLLIYELQGGNHTVILGVGGLFTVVRFFHAWGMLQHHLFFRRSSATLTYILELVLPLLILWQVLS